MSSPDTPLLTEKRYAHLGALDLACGRRLDETVLGYETYGTLSPEADNAILLCHHFMGCSHAAGRYRADDILPGWWDPLIGPGKPIDTRRFFVVAVDALGCTRRDAPHGQTSGPLAIDPATGRPYGPDFPPLAVSDSIAVQRRLLAQLGVERLYAVAGPSYGAMQAIEWAVTHPGQVERLILAVAPAPLQAREIGLYHTMGALIRLDPAFQAGRYAPGASFPGLAEAIKLMLILSGGREEFARSFDRKRDAQDADRLAFEAWLDREAPLRAPFVDPNSYLAMLHTNTRWQPAGEADFEAAMARVRADVLLVPGRGDDLLVGPDHHDRLFQSLDPAGRKVRVAPLPARYGHLAGLFDLAPAADAIRQFLA